MRLLGRIVLVLALGLAGCAAGLAWLLDARPLVGAGVDISSHDLRRVRWLLRTHDPRHQPEGATRVLILSEHDLDLLGNHLLARYARGALRVQLARGRMVLRASLRLPSSPLGGYLNLEAELVEGKTWPRLAALRVGPASVPVGPAQWLARRLVARLWREAAPLLEGDLIQRLSFGQRRLWVRYVWRDELLRRLRAGLLPAGLRARLLGYHRRLRGLLEGPPRDLPVVELIEGLLGGAAIAPGDAVAENRAALLVLGAYVNGRSLAALLPELAGRDLPAGYWPVLAGRHDLAQHFALSAALAATENGAVADLFGLYKEVADSRGGSGFSFVDLAAGRAGARLGELATASSEGARRVRRWMASGLSEADIMPETRGLPEYLRAVELERRYGGVEGAAYRALRGEIDRRIGRCALYARVSPPAGG